MNDSGSGIAAVLKTALQLCLLATMANVVRFAFWWAEEKGVNVSRDYVFELSRDQLKDIALHLAFNVLGLSDAGFIHRQR
nr:M28 family peptidase [Mycobacterium uberis]